MQVNEIRMVLVCVQMMMVGRILVYRMMMQLRSERFQFVRIWRAAVVVTVCFICVVFLVVVFWCVGRVWVAKK